MSIPKKERVGKNGKLPPKECRFSATHQPTPADIKAALIKWAIAEYIAAYSSTNYVDGDGNFVDRASRCRKEAQRILDAYRPVVAL